MASYCKWPIHFLSDVLVAVESLDLKVPNNTTADNVEKMLFLCVCVLDGQLKDTALDGPSEDES